MNVFTQKLCRWIGICSIAVVAGMAAGCDDSEYDRDPPKGQGSLIVDNFTGDRVLVYVDGVEVDGVSSGRHRFYDLDPGLYRIALDGDDVRRSWADDVDVLEGRRTVLEVRGTSIQYNVFDVRIYFD